MDAAAGRGRVLLPTGLLDHSSGDVCPLRHGDGGMPYLGGVLGPGTFTVCPQGPGTTAALIDTGVNISAAGSGSEDVLGTRLVRGRNAEAGGSHALISIGQADLRVIFPAPFQFLRTFLAASPAAAEGDAWADMDADGDIDGGGGGESGGGGSRGNGGGGGSGGCSRGTGGGGGSGGGGSGAGTASYSPKRLPGIGIFAVMVSVRPSEPPRSPPLTAAHRLAAPGRCPRGNSWVI